jgi:hypothetical protein
MYISAVLKTAAFSDKNTNSQTRIPSPIPSERQFDNITTSLLHLNINPFTNILQHISRKRGSLTGDTKIFNSTYSIAFYGHLNQF